MRVHRKTLWIWWLSYMAVALICIVAMVALYGRTINSLQSSLESNSRERAQSFAQRVDTVFTEIQSAANSIQLSSHMTALSPTRAGLKTPETVDHIRCLQQEMLTQISEKEHVESIFIWFPQSNMLLTDRANWRDEHCAFGIDHFDVTMEDLTALSDQLDTSTTAQLPNGDLLYLRKLNSRDGFRLIGIRSSSAGMLPKNSGYLQSDILLLQLDQGHLIWHNEADQWPDLASQVFSSDSSVLTLYTDHENPLAGMRGIYTKAGYEVAFVTPQSELYAPLTALRTVFIVLCAALLLLGAVMAFVFVRHQYRPIRRVADLVLSRTQETVDADVFTAIETHVNTYIKELEQKDKLLQAAEQRDQQHVLYHLITGWSVEFSSEFMQSRNISLADSHHALVCTLRPNASISQQESTVSIQAALGALQQHLYDFGLLHTLKFPQETMFLLDADLVSASDLFDTLKELAAAMEASLSLAMHIGISRPQPGIPGLQVAAREAEAALFSAIKAKQYVQWFDQNAGVDRLFFSRLSAIYDLTQNGNYQGALDLAETLSEQSGFGTLQAIALAINSAAMTVRLETPEQEEALRRIIELPSQLTRPEELREYAGRVFGQLAVSTTPEHSKQEDQVLYFLHQNFSDPQLSVSEIARRLSVSQSTLSRITMRIANLTPLDYIQRLRMEKAKELLKQGMSVSQAAEEVGCTNAAALRRIFKKFENTTPADYMN